MGVFNKEHITSSVTKLYTYGTQQTLLIVGLGNSEKKYDGTRHNIGFACLDDFAHNNAFPAWVAKKDLKCELTTHIVGKTKVMLIKPTTFMNLSGEAVQAVQHFYKLTNSQTVIVHDELDLQFGIIRTNIGGSSAGHNGIKSIIQHCGSENLGRVRIGIGQQPKPRQDAADFVLGTFSAPEQAHMKALTQEVTSILTEFVFSGATLQTDTRNFLIEA